MFDAFNSPITLHYRPRNRNTYITITNEGEICVRTPFKDMKRVRTLLKEREGWIRSKLTLIRSSQPLQQYSLGESIRFRGEIFPLSHFPALSAKIQQCNNSINIEKYYFDFYKKEAQLTIPSRVSYYARKMGLAPDEIIFKRMRRRWGSCDSRRRVTFNTLMMQLTYEQIDYIIVHELAHLKHMNHSKLFHALVGEYLPEHKKVRAELRAIRPLGH